MKKIITSAIALPIIAAAGLGSFSVASVASAKEAPKPALGSSAAKKAPVKKAPVVKKVTAKKATAKKKGPSGTCKASMYGYKDGMAGRRTASGERFNPNKLTAAHKKFKFGTKVKVTNKKTKKSVVVRINDRGPYAKGRCLDLSTTAMKKVGGFKSGVINARWEVVK